MEQSMKSSNRHSPVYGILEKAALQVCGGKVDYLTNSVEKNESDRRK